MTLRAQKRTPRPAPSIVHCTETGIYNYSTVPTAKGFELRSQSGIAVPVSTPKQARIVARYLTATTSPAITIPIPLNVSMRVREIGGAK